ncbi:MAG: hypothetical protein QMB62_10890 [Oscillospiraceae bacterium]
MINPEISAIYENYLEETGRADAAEARRFEWLSRMFTGRPSGAEVLLQAFDTNLKDGLDRLYGQTSGSAEIRELAEWMLEQVGNNQSRPQVKYSLMAALRHIIPLTAYLNVEDAVSLSKSIKAAIPSRERFPVHNELIDKLKKQSAK